VALALAFTGLLVVFWAAAKPASRIQVEEPIKVLTKRVNAGDGLRIQYTYCKQDEAIAIVAASSPPEASSSLSNTSGLPHCQSAATLS